MPSLSAQRHTRHFWSVNYSARAITKWRTACDKILARLISYILCASRYSQYCQVENTAPQCQLGLFQDADFAGGPADSKSTSGEVLCIFGSPHCSSSVVLSRIRLLDLTVVLKQKSFLRTLVCIEMEFLHSACWTSWLMFKNHRHRAT